MKPQSLRRATAKEPSKKALGVSIFHVPVCPHVDILRSYVEVALEQAGAPAVIELVEGPYASPTVLIDGLAIDGYPLTTTPACRIVLPSQDEVLAAICAAASGNPSTS